MLDVAVPAITIFVMLAVGMALTPADFVRVRQRPALVVAGLLWPLFTLPPIALVLVLLFDPPPATQAGLFLIAACPIGGISNTEFATRNIAVATAIAVTLLGRVDFALFATAYFLTEVPLMLGAVAVFRAWHVPRHADHAPDARSPAASQATAWESGASR